MRAQSIKKLNLVEQEFIRRKIFQRDIQCRILFNYSIYIKNLVYYFLYERNKTVRNVSSFNKIISIIIFILKLIYYNHEKHCNTIFKIKNSICACSNIHFGGGNCLFSYSIWRVIYKRCDTYFRVLFNINFEQHPNPLRDTFSFVLNMKNDSFIDNPPPLKISLILRMTPKSWFNFEFFRSS